jgi:glycosyltransferase involved in cell wall biosynthesis
MKKIAVLYDFPPEGNPLTEALARVSGASVEGFGMWFPTRRTAFYRYFVQTPLMALFPLSMLFKLGRFDTVFCWQQNFGIILGLIIRLFGLEVKADIHVLTFIATGRRRAWPLRPLIDYALGCRAVKTVVCFSESELELYRDTFPSAAGKFRTTVLAEDPRHGDVVTKDEGYFLAAGRENRDYDFLISHFRDRPAERLVVVCDTIAPVNASNITVHTATYGDAYIDLVAKCHGVVFAFRDPAISSGQLVFLLAVALGKPVIATRSGCLKGYLKPDENGLETAKDPAAFDAAIDALKDPGLWRRLSDAAIADFHARFSVDSFAERIIDITAQELRHT